MLVEAAFVTALNGALTQSLPADLGFWCACIGATIIVSAAILYWCGTFE